MLTQNRFRGLQIGHGNVYKHRPKNTHFPNETAFWVKGNPKKDIFNENSKPILV